MPSTLSPLLPFTAALSRRSLTSITMSDNGSSTILHLFGKSTEETALSRSLQSKNGGLTLTVDGEQENLRIILQDENQSDHLCFRSNIYMEKLLTSRFGRFLVWSPRLSSTHDLVSQNFSELPCGAVCVADVQFKGKGRVKNVWESPVGCLLFSYTMEMEDGRVLPLLQYVVTLAMTEAIKELCRVNGLPNLDVRIKWPNDLYLSGLKVGGVLCTSTYRSKKFNVCVGIGLNLDNEKPTTCLNTVLGGMCSTSYRLKREDVLAEFFNKFESLHEIFLTQGFQVLQDLYCQTWLHSGQKVVVEEKPEGKPVENIEVTIQGLTTSGYLLAIGDDGKKYELHPDGNSFDFFKGLVRRKLS